MQGHRDDELRSTGSLTSEQLAEAAAEWTERSWLLRRLDILRSSAWRDMVGSLSTPTGGEVNAATLEAIIAGAFEIGWRCGRTAAEVELLEELVK